MLLRQIHLEQEEQLAKRTIAKLQRERDSGAISEQEYEENYERVMQDYRLKFAQVMDWASWEVYNSYKNEPSPRTPYKIEVEEPVIEYITLPCNPVTKNAQ